MNTRQMETFIETADAGSFLKASERLYISPNAVTKQINTVEKELGLSLFARNHKGLKLTKAGQSFYNDAKQILQLYHEALIRAGSAERIEKNVIRVGNSSMTPSHLLMEIWPKIQDVCPDLKFELVPFENTPDTASPILQNLGHGIDVVIGILDHEEKTGEDWPCQSVMLLTEPFCIGVSVSHPLAKKDVLTMKDLEGENLLMLKKGGFAVMDQMRSEIEDRYPLIKVTDFSFYDINIFNHCETSRDLLLTVKSWDRVHPLIKILPVEWDYRVPFGILYSNNPSEQVRTFIRTATQIYSTELLD